MVGKDTSQLAVLRLASHAHFAHSQGLTEYYKNKSNAKCRKEEGHLPSASRSSYKLPVGHLNSAMLKTLTIISSLC